MGSVVAEAAAAAAAAVSADEAPLELDWVVEEVEPDETVIRLPDEVEAVEALFPLSSNAAARYVRFLESRMGEEATLAPLAPYNCARGFEAARAASCCCCC